MYSHGQAKPAATTGWAASVKDAKVEEKAEACGESSINAHLSQQVSTWSARRSKQWDTKSISPIAPSWHYDSLWLIMTHHDSSWPSSLATPRSVWEALVEQGPSVGGTTYGHAEAMDWDIPVMLSFEQNRMTWTVLRPTSSRKQRGPWWHLHLQDLYLLSKGSQHIPACRSHGN